MRVLELKLKDDGRIEPAIALIDDPAIESNFLAFASEKVEFKADDRHLITGAVLIPDKKMYRKDFAGKGECEVYFTAETIEQIAHMWMKDSKLRDFNLSHKDGVGSVTIVESWIKVSNVDKSVAMGFTPHPDGTWFITAYVSDDSLWQRIKAGEFRGFSIEAVFEGIEPEDDDPFEEFSKILAKSLQI